MSLFLDFRQLCSIHFNSQRVSQGKSRFSLREKWWDKLLQAALVDEGGMQLQCEVEVVC